AWEPVLADDEDRLGVISFNLAGHSYVEVASVLAHEWGVGVRSGCFCAHLYVAHLLGISEADSTEARERLIAGLPVELPGMVRASIGLANTKDDIDRLASGLLAIARDDIRATYVKTASGDLEPVGSTHSFEAHGESFL
ncbi:MAG TPA: aminotransferase class V-fold PLP-dependent enzyme, partial [Ktedonobacteraceae bacterium]|nr:aminotransferase class V-fold PLP-dependent enzyme [Ktedonobacteraceae bacterium]